MPNTFNFFAAITIGCALAAPVAAQDVTADTVVASVNGTDITIGHMIVLRNNLPDQYKNLDDSVLFDGILDQVIQRTAQPLRRIQDRVATRIREEPELEFFAQECVRAERVEHLAPGGRMGGRAMHEQDRDLAGLVGLEHEDAGRVLGVVLEEPADTRSRGVRLTEHVGQGCRDIGLEGNGLARNLHRVVGGVHFERSSQPLGHVHHTALESQEGRRGDL